MFQFRYELYKGANKEKISSLRDTGARDSNCFHFVASVIAFTIEITNLDTYCKFKSIGRHKNKNNNHHNKKASL